MRRLLALSLSAALAWLACAQAAAQVVEAPVVQPDAGTLGDLGAGAEPSAPVMPAYGDLGTPGLSVAPQLGAAGLRQTDELPSLAGTGTNFAARNSSLSPSRLGAAEESKKRDAWFQTSPETQSSAGSAKFDLSKGAAGNERTILVTGFEPFGEFSSNISGQAAQRLDGKSITVQGVPYRIVGRTLPVSDDAAQELERLKAEHKPHGVLMMGQSGRTPAVEVEKVAKDPKGGAGYETNAPVHKLVDALKAAAVPVLLSLDAGVHQCNALFHAALQSASRSGSTAPTAFVHLPPATEHLTEAQQARMGSQPASVLHDATEKIAAWLAGAAHAGGTPVKTWSPSVSAAGARPFELPDPNAEFEPIGGAPKAKASVARPTPAPAAPAPTPLPAPASKPASQPDPAPAPKAQPLLLPLPAPSASKPEPAKPAGGGAEPPLKRTLDKKTILSVLGVVGIQAAAVAAITYEAAHGMAFGGSTGFAMTWLPRAAAALAGAFLVVPDRYKKWTTVPMAVLAMAGVFVIGHSLGLGGAAATATGFWGIVEKIRNAVVSYFHLKTLATFAVMGLISSNAMKSIELQTGKAMKKKRGPSPDVPKRGEARQHLLIGGVFGLLAVAAALSGGWQGLAASAAVSLTQKWLLGSLKKVKTAIAPGEETPDPFPTLRRPKTSAELETARLSLQKALSADANVMGVWGQEDPQSPYLEVVLQDASPARIAALPRSRGGFEVRARPLVETTGPSAPAAAVPAPAEIAVSKKTAAPPPLPSREKRLERILAARSLTQRFADIPPEAISHAAEGWPLMASQLPATKRPFDPAVPLGALAGARSFPVGPGRELRAIRMPDGRVLVADVAESKAKHQDAASVVYISDAKGVLQKAYYSVEFYDSEGSLPSVEDVTGIARPGFAAAKTYLGAAAWQAAEELSGDAVTLADTISDVGGGTSPLEAARAELYKAAGGSPQSGQAKLARLTTAQRIAYFRSAAFKAWVASEKAEGKRVFWLKDIDGTQAAGDSFIHFFDWRSRNGRFTQEQGAALGEFLKSKGERPESGPNANAAKVLELYEAGKIGLLDFWTGAYWPSQAGMTKQEKLAQAAAFAPEYRSKFFADTAEDNRALREAGVEVVFVTNGDEDLARAAAPLMGAEASHVIGSRPLYGPDGRGLGRPHSYDIYDKDWSERPQPGKVLLFRFWENENGVDGAKAVIAGMDGDSAGPDGGVMIFMEPVIASFMVATPGAAPDRIELFRKFADKYGAWERGRFVTLVPSPSPIP